MTSTQVGLERRPAFLTGTAGATKGLFIDGQWAQAESGKSFHTYNPADGTVLATLAAGESADVDRAVKAARRAFTGEWSTFRPHDRQRALLKLAELIERELDDFALLDTLDMGAPISGRYYMANVCIERTYWYASQAHSIHGETRQNSLPGHVQTYTLREPVGVIGAIIPWNGPLDTTIWKLGPVLATGCTAVLKPSEEASLTCLRLAELCIEAGVPAGVVNVVTGSGAKAGAALAAHPDVDKVSFTGSTATGRKIVQASTSNLKRLTLELGGKSPDVVFADADLDAAVAGAAMGAFVNSGQVCCAGTRLFVERGIYEEFTERVAAFAAALRVGNGLDPATEIGPVVSAGQLDRVVGYLDAGAAEGARAIAGGARLTTGEFANGYYVPPTVFVGVTDAMSIAREEIFGPVISALPFDSFDEVLTRANGSEYGLAGGVWTRDLNKAQAFVRGMQAGTVYVNCYNYLDPALPFGGYKASGYGRDCGPESLDDVLNTKAVYINTD